jgi:hypothetical protein
VGRHEGRVCVQVAGRGTASLARSSAARAAASASRYASRAASHCPPASSVAASRILRARALAAHMRTFPNSSRPRLSEGATPPAGRPGAAALLPSPARGGRGGGRGRHLSDTRCSASSAASAAPCSSTPKPSSSESPSCAPARGGAPPSSAPPMRSAASASAAASASGASGGRGQPAGPGTGLWRGHSCPGEAWARCPPPRERGPRRRHEARRAGFVYTLWRASCAGANLEEQRGGARHGWAVCGLGVERLRDEQCQDVADAPACAQRPAHLVPARAPDAALIREEIPTLIRAETRREERCPPRGHEEGACCARPARGNAGGALSRDWGCLCEAERGGAVGGGGSPARLRRQRVVESGQPPGRGRLKVLLLRRPGRALRVLRAKGPHQEPSGPASRPDRLGTGSRAGAPGLSQADLSGGWACCALGAEGEARASLSSGEVAQSGARDGKRPASAKPLCMLEALDQGGEHAQGRRCCRATLQSRRGTARR